ncbi:MAG: hypothetical protein EBT75_09935, partial [Proteobacteria bacterium]|nr:hypothetical protein [Pseudomonadota bacterium]NBS78974.1 hypothetical protein [bacterium]NBT23442.1 hypothetical protein [bacterium]
ALAAKDLANLRQTATLVLTAAAEFGKIPGATLDDGANNWVKVVREYLPGSYPPDGEFPPVKLLDPNHPYLCPSLSALRPDLPMIRIGHQWAMNWSVNMAPLPAIARPSKTVMLTTACFSAAAGWGALQFFPSERRNPDFPYPSRRLSLTDPTGMGPPDRATLMAFVDGHVERVSFRDTNYFPVNAAKPAWTP